MSEIPIYYIGVDVGQRVDHSAVCLVEQEENRIIVRLLVKYPLGTAFPKLVDTLIKYVYKPAIGKGQVYGFTIDATGIGSAPAQMLQERIPEIRIDNFIFTNQKKREIVGKVKMLHAFGKLKFATKKGDDFYNRTLSELVNEMKQLQVRVIREDINNPELEVFKTGTHDDLFTALALAVKDINVDLGGMGSPVAFMEDKTWVKTPMIDNVGTPVVFF